MKIEITLTLVDTSKQIIIHHTEIIFDGCLLKQLNHIMSKDNN